MADSVISKVRFTWNITYDCNYRCSYCFFDGKWQEYAQRTAYLSVDDWVRHWSRVAQKYGQIYLVITGGEPFTYPNFIPLIKELSKICFHINISTNASVNISKFIEQIDPRKVSLSLSFQKEFVSLDNYIEKLRLIRKHNFKGCLNLVAYPPFLEDLEKDKRRLREETQEEFKVIPFFGKYKNVEYPQGYTREERELIGIDDAWFSRVRRKGTSCSAGKASALVFPDGKVARCGQIGERLLLGNFFDPDFRLFDKSMECDAEYCPCQEDSIESEEEPGTPDAAESSTHGISKIPDVVTATELVNSTAGVRSPAVMKKFAWDIHYKCNFRCPYCWFYKDWARLSSRNVYLGPDEWMVHWRRIYEEHGEVKVEIVGGEPFIYPDFIELVKKLSFLHRVKITTNLSGNIERFAKEIDPRRVELDLNFHILFIDLETVIKKTLILKEAGFKAGVCYLAYPPQMHKIKYLAERFRQEGIDFALAAFWGEHNGKKYPAAYSEEEKELMRPYLGDIDRITYHLDAKSPRGKLCNAGFTYADIQADGNVVRCSALADKSIGNILDGNFKLFSEPLPCESDSCSSNEYVNLLEGDAPGDTLKVDSSRQIEQVRQEKAFTTPAQKEGQPFYSMPSVLFPRLVPPYRVHWNWELGLKCNYKCTYCHVWPKGKDERFPQVDIKTWKAIWDRMFEKYWCCHVRFSGGEPTIYPDFFDIVSAVLEKHTVDITTNLSFDIKSFREKVKPGGISISASFHPEFNMLEAFLEKVLFLHHNGYPSTIAYVAYPPHLKSIQSAKALVEKNRIMFKIIPYQGEFQGKKYPEAYTPQERSFMEGLSADSADGHLNDLNTRWYEWNVKRDKERKDTKGSLCRMGQMYAKIFSDGRVARCCAQDKNGQPLGILGHIADLDLRLLDEPSPCEADTCPCFKGMLVGNEEEKWLPLWEGLEHPLYKTEEMIKFAQDKTRQPSSEAVLIHSADKKELAVVNENTGDRKSVIPHRVFFTWDIHYACNYRCAYCFFAKKWDEVAKENRYIELDTWKRVWDGIYARYGSGHIHVSGGEPFTYPSFIDLVAYLASNYTVEFDTNLAFDVDDFILKINPGRVKFATAFHPTFVSLEVYLEKVLKLKRAGYDTGINYVAYPLQLERMKEYKDTFEKHQITFTIMPFRGEFEGRTYPQGYTQDQQQYIRECDSNLMISSKMIDWYGKDKLSRKGAICRMGQMYTKIHPNGDAFRCCFINDKGRLGNIIDGTFALWDQPQVCEYPECPCWTAMVIGQEEEWQSHWVIPGHREVQESLHGA